VYVERLALRRGWKVVLMAKIPMINITDYSVDVLTLEPTPSYEPDLPVICNVNVAFSIERQQENNQFFRVRAMFKFEPTESEDLPTNLPYKAAIAATGYFVTPIPLPVGDNISAAIATNALLILYGTCRGIVGTATASGERGKLVIPTVAFDDIVRKAPNVIFDEAEASGSDGPQSATRGD